MTIKINSNQKRKCANCLSSMSDKGYKFCYNCLARKEHNRGHYIKHTIELVVSRAYYRLFKILKSYYLRFSLRVILKRPCLP